MDFSVFVSNTFVIERSIWQLWLMGLTVDQSTSHIQKKRPNLQSTPLRHYITSQYRSFSLLEPYLHHPRSLQTQLLIPLNLQLATYLTQSYYSFDDRVARELLGKKLSSKTRKDLEDVCEKTRIPLGGCRRMFDNFKRVTKVVEDKEGIMVETIIKEFLLPRELANKYAHIIFISTYRLDTSKRKLSNLSFPDFSHLASIFMEHFSLPQTPLEQLDPLISQSSRDLKNLLLNRQILDQYRSVVIQHTQMGETKISTTTFKLLLRNILNIGTSLSQNKELRDIFLAILEKIIEPSMASAWSQDDFESFMTGLKEKFGELEGLSPQIRKRYEKNFERLVDGLRCAGVRFYEAAGRDAQAGV